jgi:hypothetical protein
MFRNQIHEVSPISELVPVDLQQVCPVWHEADTTSLAASPHLVSGARRAARQRLTGSAAPSLKFQLK